MKLVLHIGMAKTGTSTLQTALVTNRKLLDRRGICFPSPAKAVNHSALTCCLQPVDRIPRQFKPRGDETLEVLRERGQRFWNDISREVRRSSADCAVLSSEHLFYLREDEVVGLRDLLRQLFDPIRVVAYVRQPASYYLAMTQQRIKASYRVTPPRTYRLPLRKCLERYQQVFEGNLDVRPFDRTRLVGQDIVADFLSSALPRHPGLREELEVGDQNESMSAEAMCIVQRLRRFAWPDGNDVFTPETERVIDTLRTMGGQTTARLTPGIAAIVTQRHQDDLDWLDRGFGLRFDPPSPPAGEIEPEVGTSEDLTSILDIDLGRVEACLYEVVKRLAAP